MESLLARLKTRDPHRGQVLRRFVYRGIRFEEGKGWYRVSPEVGEYLRAVRQRPSDPHSRPAFDVCTEAEATAIDERETEAAKPARPADRAKETAPREGPPPVPDDALDDGDKGGGKRGRKAQG
jgi:hypothetical protein